MIGSFWNLCRACPSMPLDKLHSEYRSTYKWHEFKGAGVAAAGGGPGAGATGAVVSKPPAPQQQDHINQINRGIGPIEAIPAMPRRKKYPGVAYKTNDIFDPKAEDRSGPMSISTYDRARSIQRSQISTVRAGRRSKSEGPPQGAAAATRWTDTIETKQAPPSLREITKAVPVKEGPLPGMRSEYRNQFAWPKDGAEETGQPRKSVSMGALKAAGLTSAKNKKNDIGGVLGGSNELEPLMNHVDGEAAHEPGSKRYIEDYLWNGEKVGVHRKTTFRTAFNSLIRNGKPDPKTEPSRMNYKSEYKKKFRPFSHYIYEASKGTFTKCRTLGKKAVSVERDDGAAEKMLNGDHVDGGPRSLTTVDRGDRGDSWFTEVLDLRKRAGEYKYRGWGTELAPDHLTELYNKQMELWQQVSRRSSLSALSLASTPHRAITKDDKEKELDKSRVSPKKSRSFKSAPPHQSVHAKIQETRQLEKSPQKVQRKKLHGQTSEDPSVTAEGRHTRASARTSTSPRKQLNLVIGKGQPGDQFEETPPKTEFKASPKRRPRSADPKAQQNLANGPVEEKRRPTKPTGLALNSARSRKSAHPGFSRETQANMASAQNHRSRSVSKAGKKIDDVSHPHRSASVAKDHIFDDTPVVKSPPEPTRVKSPEQMNMRSPDPVNWTVPLDTGKTFTVTQNVKDDGILKRPGSDFRGGHSLGAEDSAATDHSQSAIAKVDATIAVKELPSVHGRNTPNDLGAKIKPDGGNQHQQAKVTHAKTPTSPPSLTPIKESDSPEFKIVNGTSPVKKIPGTDQLRLDDPYEGFHMEATCKRDGAVDTSLVDTQHHTSLAADVLDRARNRFDKFWGRKESTNENV